MERPVTIILTGGGSGGHITPILSVAHELKHKKPGWRLVYIGQKGDRLASLANNSDIDEVKSVRAGKFRRYHSQSWIEHLLDLPSQLLNIRDIFYLLFGTLQAVLILKKLKPAAIMLKGGYVGVPVAWAARLLRIPYLTHDSDSVAGLANRLVSKHAVWHATGMPASFYNYPASNTSYVGVPVSSQYKPVSIDERNTARSELQIASGQFVILVIGGSLGADRLNKLVIKASPEIVRLLPKAFIVHLSGHRLFEDVLAGYAKQLGTEVDKHVKIIDYSEEVYKLNAAADLVITRAGATTLAELALQHKTVISVPNADLTGGHQLKNSELLKSKEAIAEFPENYLPKELAKLVYELASDKSQMQYLAKNLAHTAKPDAASDLADLVIEVAGQK